MRLHTEMKRVNILRSPVSFVEMLRRPCASVLMSYFIGRRRKINSTRPSEWVQTNTNKQILVLWTRLDLYFGLDHVILIYLDPDFRGPIKQMGFNTDFDAVGGRF